MIDYVFAVVVGLLAAAALGYAYRAAHAAEDVLKRLIAWEEAWRQYYAQYSMPAESQKVRESSISPPAKKPENLPAVGEGGDYIEELLKKIACAGELMKSYGGCAPIDEVMSKCGLAKLALRSLFNIKENKGEVCLRGA